MSNLSEIDGLPPEFFEEKRSLFFKNLKRRFAHLNRNSILVLQGAEEVPKYDTDVNYYYFEQDPNFYYLTGIRFPHMMAILDIQSEKCDIFYKPDDDEERIWQTVPTIQDIEKRYNLPTHDMKEFYPFIQRRNMEVIYVLGGVNGNSGLPVISAKLNFVGELDYLNKRISHDEIVYQTLCETRMAKTKSEQEVLKFIGQASVEAHKKMMSTIKPGMTERDMENCFNNYLRETYNCRWAGYLGIAGCGRGCSILHYRDNDKELKDGDLFLSDQGGRFLGYDADITTTFPINGKFTKEQRDIYEIVLQANRKIMEVSKAGQITKKKLDDISKIIIIEGLQKLGIISPLKSAEQLFNDGMARIFMPHSIGHYLGLDVHDVGPKIDVRSEQMLTEGMYLTVEPGIYFIRMLIDQAKVDPKLKDYINYELYEKYFYIGGVRIEDNYLVFNDHVENFTDGIPRTPDEIEKFMKENNPNCKDNVIGQRQ